MLAGVLLHVVEASRPLDVTRDCRPCRKRRGQNMNDLIVYVDCLDHLDRGSRRLAPFCESTDVKWLATGCRIERRAIEHHGRMVFVLECADDDSFETTAVRIGVVNPGGHAAP